MIQEKIQICNPKFQNKNFDEVKKKRLELSLSECENLEIRTLKCPCCDFPIAGIFADAVGHFHIKCGKCKAVMVINLAYFRRIKNISKGDLEYISKKDFIK